MTEPFGQRMSQLLDDPAFRSVLKASADHWLPYEAFLEMPLPSILSPRQTWDLLRRLRNIEGIKGPGVIRPELEAWYTLTLVIFMAMVDPPLCPRCPRGPHPRPARTRV